MRSYSAEVERHHRTAVQFLSRGFHISSHFYHVGFVMLCGVLPHICYGIFDSMLNTPPLCAIRCRYVLILSKDDEVGLRVIRSSLISVSIGAILFSLGQSEDVRHRKSSTTK